MKTKHGLIKFIVIRWYVEFRKVEFSCADTGGRTERGLLIYPEEGLDHG